MAPKPLRVALLAVAAIVASVLPAVLVPQPVASQASSTAGVWTVDAVAGNGTFGWGGDGGLATQAQLTEMSAVVLDQSGNVFVPNRHRVRKIDTSGIITTVVGTTEGNSGDGGPASQAQLKNTGALAFDSHGNLYIWDRQNGVIRKVVPGADGVINGGSDEIITTVAGPGPASPDCSPEARLSNGGNCVYLPYSTGDGGPATLARVSPGSLAFDEAGNMYTAGDGRVRKVLPGSDGVINGGADEIITTVAGTGERGFSGDGGPATQAKFSSPQGIDIDSGGNLYIVDSQNSRIRKVIPGADAVLNGGSDEIITTIAGSGASGFIGDGGPAIEAGFADPSGVAIDTGGNLYIADTGNHRIRQVTPTGVITTVAGGASSAAQGDPSSSGDGGPAVLAGLPRPEGITVDAGGGVYFTEPAYARPRVRRAGPDLLTPKVTDSHDPVALGGQLSYEATVANYSGGAATGVVLTDTLPAGTQFVSANRSCSHAGGTVTCALGDIGSQQTTTVNITVVVPAEPVVLNNKVVVSSDQVDVFEANNTKWQDTTVAVPADLSVTTTDAPDPAATGQSFEYLLTVANDGPSAAGEVVVTDTLPEGVKVGLIQASQQSNLGCNRVARTITCRLGLMAPGGRATVSVQVTAPSDPTVLVNTAKVEAVKPFDAALPHPPEPQPFDDDNTSVEQTTVVFAGSPEAGLRLTKVDSPDPASLGEPLTYTITVKNETLAPAVDLSVVDALPSQMSYESATASQGTCSQASGTVTCDWGDVAGGASATATIVVTPTAPGQFTNTVTLYAADQATSVRASATTKVTPWCGEVITENTVLTHDIGPCESTGLVIGADNITLDLGGHRVFGTPGPSDRTKNGDILGNQAGIYLQGRTSVTVKGGSVTDFDAGVFLRGGSSNTITELLVKDNIGPGGNNSAVLGDGIALFDSANNSIVANTVVHNGVYDGIFVGGGGSDGNLIKDNVIEDTYSVRVSLDDGSHNHGQGIMVNASSIGNPAAQTIQYTRVVGNIVRRSAAAGISNINNIDGVIFANTIENNGGVNGPANGIGVQTGPGYSGPTNLVIQSNEIHGNKANGLEIHTRANRLLNNNVADNDTGNNSKFYDLSDPNGCSGNTWAGNTWGRGGYSDICLTAPDTAGPPLTIVSGPEGPTADDTPSFGFSSPEPATTFACRVDTEAFAPCASPHTTAVRTAGAHTFEVQGTDPAGNATTATRAFSVGAVAAAVSAIADFNGDGASDISVFRAGSGSWFPQGGAADAWGTDGDIAVPADYDGAAGSEMAVFRPSSGTWFVKGGATTAWGTEGDLPVPGDYDGDKKADVAVFRPSTGAWYIHPSGGGADQSVGWGTTGDIPVPGDYNGDGTTEIAVFRPSSGTWFVLGGPTIAWGTEGDIPVPGDYDANGDTDMAVFRPSSGTWFVEGGPTLAWGTEGDIPVPGDFDGNASADIAVFRPSSGTWFVNGGATTNWGTAGDQPLALPAAIRQSL